MEPRLLRSFVAVAEELHFGRAARRLHLSQPPLSMQIRRLEDELGTRLFDRDRRGDAQTEAGHFLLGRARRLLGDGERAAIETQRIGRGLAGVLVIGYAPNATYRVLPPLVRAFRARRPDVRLELIELRSPDQALALRDGRIEVGFACVPIEPAGLHDLQELPMSHERMMVVLPRAHPLARRPRIAARALIGQPYVAVRPDLEPGWARRSTEALARAGVTLEIAQETDSKLAMLGLVAAGVGLSVVSESMRVIARDGVVFRPLIGVATRLTLSLIAPAQPSPRAQELIALARAR